MTTLTRVPPTRVPKRQTTGWLIKLLTFFAQRIKVKTQQVVKNRVQHCGDIEPAGYLANEVGPVPLVLDLRIAHDRVGSSTDPTLNGHLKYPNNLDQSLNDAAADKIRKYRTDYNNRRRVWYHLYLLLRVRVGGYIVNLSDFYSYRLIGKLTAFLQLQEFSLRKHNVACSTTVARRSLLS